MNAIPRSEVLRSRMGFVSDFIFVVHGVVAIVPIGFLILALSLILRARFKYGHWPKRGIPSFDGAGTFGYINGDPALGDLGLHFRIVEWLAELDISILTVLASIHLA